ncbi:phospholipase D family protein [Edwardsiella tarda]|nr:phospholipase D family protein [Edwardsiella tarda]UCQ12802.1 phospholipase D family protein [Edwardsiella tarda]GAC63814.1 hypothetical protein ET1_07_00430 [Edwardsiella tarda ATCC 15947 = NBRC 105688]STD44733.1 Predicted HKD family nuclease [Edwardsiella tarda]
MRIVFAEKIAEYIKNCSPEYIAVAFVGADWREFIPDWKKIKSIVVSPTLGSNPKAIHEIVKELGWEKVEFLDNLHAKLYLGENSAISGSANLTKNGLSGNILHELCTVTHNPQHLKSFKIFFDHIRSKAKDSYPTVEQKKHKLDELFQVWGAAVSQKLLNDTHHATQFKDFELLSNNHFYISWYQISDCEYSAELQGVEDYIDDNIHFLPSDNIEKNRWVLTWKKTNDGKPHKRVALNWLYIHELFENGIVTPGYGYTKVAIQRKDLQKPEPPFELTPDVVKAFKEVVACGVNRKYFVQPDDEFYNTNYGQTQLPKLIDDMKEKIKDINASK